MEQGYEEMIIDKELAKSVKDGIKNYREGKTKKFNDVQEAIEYLDEYIKMCIVPVQLGISG